MGLWYAENNKQALAGQLSSSNLLLSCLPLGKQAPFGKYWAAEQIQSNTFWCFKEQDGSCHTAGARSLLNLQT